METPEEILNKLKSGGKKTLDELHMEFRKEIIKREIGRGLDRDEPNKQGRPIHGDI
jgi:hypothetical protein